MTLYNLCYEIKYNIYLLMLKQNFFFPFEKILEFMSKIVTI